MKILKNKIYISTVLFVAACLFSSCSNSSQFKSESASNAPISYGDATVPEMAVKESSDTEVQAESVTGLTPLNDREQKIMKNGNLTVETFEYDMFIADIETLVTSNGGYVESYNAYISDSKDNLRTGNFTIKVPAENYAKSFIEIKTYGKVLKEQESQVNVSEQFYDVSARLESKKLQETRVLEMIDKAKTVEELLLLEQTLSEIRTSIELFESDLNYLERNTSYSSIYINVIEKNKVSSIKPSFENLGDKIASSFNSSINMLLFLLEGFVVLISWLIVPIGLLSILFLLFNVIKKLFRKNNTKKKNNS